MLKQIITGSLLVIFTYFLLIYFLQRQLIYHPTKDKPSRQTFQAKDMQQLSVPTKDSLLLNAWYKPAMPGKPTILFLHGNAGDIGNRMPLTRQFLNAGFGVLLLDYRGYGGNQGKPTEQGLYEDGRAAVQFLQQQQIPTARIVLYGESLGTGVATKLASELPACALVLQSPYTSMSALARYHYPWIFLSPWDKYDSLGRVSSIHIPLLILHGSADDIVPYTQGLALFAKANEPKQFVKLTNKGHNNLWNNEFINKVNAFINTFCESK